MPMACAHLSPVFPARSSAHRPGARGAAVDYRIYLAAVLLLACLWLCEASEAQQERPPAHENTPRKPIEPVK